MGLKLLHLHLGLAAVIFLMRLACSERVQRKLWQQNLRARKSIFLIPFLYRTGDAEEFRNNAYAWAVLVGMISFPAYIILLVMILRGAI